MNKYSLHVALHRILKKVSKYSLKIALFAFSWVQHHGYIYTCKLTPIIGGVNHLEWHFVFWTHPTFQAQNWKWKFWPQFRIFITYLMKNSTSTTCKCHLLMKWTWAPLSSKWMHKYSCNLYPSKNQLNLRFSLYIKMLTESFDRNYPLHCNLRNLPTKRWQFVPWACRTFTYQKLTSG